MNSPPPLRFRSYSVSTKQFIPEMRGLSHNSGDLEHCIYFEKDEMKLESLT